MPSPSLLNIAGSRGETESRYAPIFTDRFFVGLWTNRNPLRSPLSTFYADGWHLGGTDALIAGTNVELSPRLTMCRRPGCFPFSTATVPTPPDTFYSFKPFGGTINLIADTPTHVYMLTSSALTSIFTKGASAGQANFLGIGNTLYFGDGVETEAWQNGTIRNWGISIGPFSNSIGPNTAGAGSDVSITSGTAWTNPGNVTSAVSYASCTPSIRHVGTDNLLATQFGFAIALGEGITGIEITFDEFTFAGVGPATLQAQLLKNGSPVGTIRSRNLDSGDTFTFGSPSDLWGSTWSASDLNQALWGVQFQGSSGGIGSPPDFNIKNVNATIFGTGGPSVTTTAGTLSPTVGYKYVTAYGNATSGQVSTATPPSALIKPVAQGVSISLVASSDPQVNQIWVFRTADNGSTYLNLPNSPFPNTTGSVTDNAPDTSLNILQQAPINHANDPPPVAALDPVLYLGLVWIHSGNAVYFSRTPSAVVGITQESFPPANVFTFPETVIRKIPINSGLLILTTSNIYIIAGQNTSNSPLFSAPFLSGYGILSWNALWLDGSIIYFFTSDKRLIKLDPSSGVEDMGFPIGDILATLNPASVYVTYQSSTSNDAALYVSDGSTGWYRCNPNQAPDGQITGPVWSPKATIVGGCGALAAVETSPGIHQLLIGGTGNGSSVLVRDSSYTIFTDNGSAYPSNYTIGSIVLAQPGQVALMRFVSANFKRIGSQPTVSVLLGEISGTFENISGYVVNEPPYLPASTSLFNNRYYFRQSIGGAPPPVAKCQHLQIMVDYGQSDTVQNEILSLTINGALVVEK